MQAWIPVVSSSLYFWKSVFSFRAGAQTVFWNQMAILYQTESFLTTCISFGAWSRQAVIETIVVVYELPKRTQPVRPLGTIIQSIFCAQSQASIRLNFSEIVWWELVPRGSFARTWEHSSCLFSRPDWQPLGLRGWAEVRDQSAK